MVTGNFFCQDELGIDTSAGVSVTTSRGALNRVKLTQRATAVLVSVYTVGDLYTSRRQSVKQQAGFQFRISSKDIMTKGCW